MTRYVVAVIIGCVYIAGTSWLVSREGEAYRRSLRPQDDRSLGPKGDAVVVGAPTGGEPSPSAPAPAPVVSDVPEAVSRPVEMGVEPTASPSSGSPDLVVATRPAPAPAPDPLPPNIPAEPTAARPVGLSPFIARLPDPVTYDVRDLGVEDEKRLGQELHELILSRQLVMENAGLTKRVRLASRPLITKGFRRGLPEDAFTILDSEDPFAFSHPGGYFYLSGALFALLSSEEELQFVMAHEMAHVELKHALKQLEAQQSKLQGLGTAEQLYRLIPQGYESAQEYEADRWAVTLLLKLDHTRRECLAFLRKFKGYSEDHGFGEGRKRPKFGLTSPVQEVENHFRAHPAAWERLDRLEQSFDALKTRSPIAR